MRSYYFYLFFKPIFKLLYYFSFIKYHFLVFLYTFYCIFYIINLLFDLVLQMHQRYTELADKKIEKKEDDFIRQLLLLTCQKQPKEVAKMLLEEGRVSLLYLVNHFYSFSIC